MLRSQAVNEHGSLFPCIHLNSETVYWQCASLSQLDRQNSFGLT